MKPASNVEQLFDILNQQSLRNARTFTLNMLLPMNFPQNTEEEGLVVGEEGANLKELLNMSPRRRMEE